MGLRNHRGVALFDDCRRRPRGRRRNPLNSKHALRVAIPHAERESGPLGAPGAADRLQASEDSGTLRDGMTRRIIAFTVAGVLVCGPLLAYADPPDPTWIAGFWDDADYDDVIARITSTSIAAELHPPCVLEPHWVIVWLLPPGDDRFPPRPAIASHRPRAPPAA